MAESMNACAKCWDCNYSLLFSVCCRKYAGGKIALEGLYVQATGEEFSAPEPVCEREMRALEVIFEAMHGEIEYGSGHGSLENENSQQN